MDRFFCRIENCVKNARVRHAAYHADPGGSGGAHCALFCVVLIGAMLLFGAAVVKAPAVEPAQPVFFSLLFPQLLPQYEPEETDSEGCCPWPAAERACWKAVFL
ncbi:MAG: hypothetical protein IKU34_06700 [Clostridia bacterium]|nr:hypothetical protein [Clostridia bacterium]